MRLIQVIILLVLCAGIPSWGISQGPPAPRRNPAAEQRRPIVEVPPVYPEEARRLNLRGVVLIEVVISSEGRVTGSRVIGGHPLLVPAAIQAVRQWRYRPVLLNGRPVETVTLARLDFPPVRQQD